MRAALDEAILYAKELLAGVESVHGPIQHRKMFGGAGLYAAERIFALIVEGELLLKGDAALGAAYEAAGATRWAYTGKNRAAPVQMPYWSLPPDALDHPEAACAWAMRAIQVAISAPNAAKRKRKLSPKLTTPDDSR